MKKLFTILFLSLLFATFSQAQVKIGLPAGAPQASAILDLSNTGAGSTAKKGFLGPQVSLSGTMDVSTVPSPATGLLVFNTNTTGTDLTAVIPGYYFYNGTQWEKMISSSYATGRYFASGKTGLFDVIPGNRQVILPGFNSSNVITGGTNSVNSNYYCVINVTFINPAPNADYEINFNTTLQPRAVAVTILTVPLITDKTVNGFNIYYSRTTNNGLNLNLTTDFSVRLR